MSIPTRKFEIQSAVADKLDQLWSDVARSIYKRDYVRALKLLKLIIQIDRHNASAYNRIAIVRAKQGNLKAAARAFLKANQYEPSAASNHNLGLIRYEQELYKLSAKYFNNALLIEHDLAPRHIAMAKVQEKLGNETAVLVHLKEAFRLEDSKQIRAVYLDAMSRYRMGEGLSAEMIEALKYNKLPWAYEALDDYEYARDLANEMCNKIDSLIHRLRDKKMSIRSSQTQELGVIFLHDTRASLELIHKNYSHAALNLTRSVYEIYLKVIFATRIKSYRGYAEIERTTLSGKLKADQRLLKQIDIASPYFLPLTASLKSTQRKINILDGRYKNLAPLPSFRQMAIQLDGDQLGENYQLFTALYDRGSDSAHAEKNAVERLVVKSGTKQAGLFIDSYDLSIYILKLMLRFGSIIVNLPEVSNVTRISYEKYSQKIAKDIAKLSQ